MTINQPTYTLLLKIEGIWFVARVTKNRWRIISKETGTTIIRFCIDEISHQPIMSKILTYRMMLGYCFCRNASRAPSNMYQKISYIFQSTENFAPSAKVVGGPA